MVCVSKNEGNAKARDKGEEVNTVKTLVHVMSQCDWKGEAETGKEEP